MKYSPMTGTFCRMSFLTFGTSAKKNKANMPAETPKPARVPPYLIALGMERPKKLGRCFVLGSCQCLCLG